MATSSKPAAAVDPEVALAHRFPEVAQQPRPPPLFHATSSVRLCGFSRPSLLTSPVLAPAGLLRLRREVRARCVHDLLDGTPRSRSRASRLMRVFLLDAGMWRCTRSASGPAATTPSTTRSYTSCTTGTDSHTLRSNSPSVNPLPSWCQLVVVVAVVLQTPLLAVLLLNLANS